MRQIIQRLLCIVLLAGLVSLAYGLNYQYVSDEEFTRFGDRIKFWHGDTLHGVVRSNSAIAIMQDPVFYDLVITTEADFWRGSGYNPQFRGPRPIFNAPEFSWPEQATWIREQALAGGQYYSGGDSLWARVVLDDHRFRLWWNPLGVPFDSGAWIDCPLHDVDVLFFDCAELHLSGTLHTELILGVRGRVGLADNVLYASADSLTGVAPAGHTEKLAVVAEGEIKVLNTVANGRRNANGFGYNQPDHRFASIVLDGIYAALDAEFTFEQQNDPDSGYVCMPCGCSPNGMGGGPDDRGTIYLYGSLHQKRRGYVHRSTCTSTGYLKQYRYDPELRDWNVPLFTAPENQVTPSALTFGAVAVGETAWDTLTFENQWVPVRLRDVTASEPFVVVPLANPDTLRWLHRFAVGFAPTVPGDYTGTLDFIVPYYDSLAVSIPLSGSAQPSSGDPQDPALPAAFALSAWPNPFNSSAVLRFVLPRAGHVRLGLYDTLGREVAVLTESDLSAGVHERRLDAAGLPTGLYLARLSAPGHTATAKLLLIR